MVSDTAVYSFQLFGMRNLKVDEVRIVWVLITMVLRTADDLESVARNVLGCAG
jgi:hypothetical protein